MIKIIGRISVYDFGPTDSLSWSSPYIFPVIIDQHDGEIYAIYPSSLWEELRRLQHRNIEFTVIKENVPKTNASVYIEVKTIMVVEWRILQ